MKNLESPSAIARQLLSECRCKIESFTNIGKKREALDVPALKDYRTHFIIVILKLNYIKTNGTKAVAFAIRVKVVGI